jgi:hypothetical protein
VDEKNVLEMLDGRLEEECASYTQWKQLKGGCGEKMKKSPDFSGL